MIETATATRAKIYNTMLQIEEQLDKETEAQK